MPSRASTSFLRLLSSPLIKKQSWWCQCPLGLVPHFYRDLKKREPSIEIKCQCPLGLVPHFYSLENLMEKDPRPSVSMPSRASTSFLRLSRFFAWRHLQIECQCPLGLVPHFYNAVAMVLAILILSCQCPLGLVPHFYIVTLKLSPMMKIVCQCPLGLVPHFYLRQAVYYENSFEVSMPSRASTSFLL